MITITVDDLVDYKILPFNIFNENGEAIMFSGEIITPGKLLQLRYLSALYREETEEDAKQEQAPEIEITPQRHSQNVENDMDTLNIVPSHREIPDLLQSQQNKIIDPFEKAVNFKSTINEQAQLQLKSLYNKTMSDLTFNVTDENVKQVRYIRDKILDEFLPVLGKTYRKSQMKIIGDYNKYHGLNVALLSTMLSKKLGLNDAQTADIVLAALMHDIGKTKLPKEVIESTHSSNTSNAHNNKLLQLHPQLGYKILKNEMNMPENICRAALEHHEKNDGSGYPYGISGDLIGQYSQIVSICNAYDNLISGKSNTTVGTTQEAVKVILEMGTSWFSPGVLFSFVYMTNYYDNTPVEELGVMVNLDWKQ